MGRSRTRARVERGVGPELGEAAAEHPRCRRRPGERAPDLAQMISRLENYREQAPDLNLNRIEGLKESNLHGKRRLIQAHLRDRLFEILSLIHI